MDNNWINRRTLAILFWPVPLLGAVGLWLWLADGDGVAGLLSVAALILTALLGLGRLSRARAARRFRAAVDAYAEQELDLERCRNGWQSVRSISARGGALPAKGVER